VISPITLRREHEQAMVDHVRRQWPEEACGLLAGKDGQVQRVYSIENIRHSRVDYFMDPSQQVRAMLEIEAAGWEVASIFHSHPAGPLWPSTTDIDRAYYPDAVYLILAPAAGSAWEMRGFDLNAGQVREIPILVTA
jgi:proteasome lid subunit RPN8/RPN11